jgi:hypothetical protein
LFKAVRTLRAGSQIANLAPDAVTEIANLAPGAVTDIAHLAPEFTTIGTGIADTIAPAAASLQEVHALGAFTNSVMRASQSADDMVQLFMGQSDEIAKMLKTAERMYRQGIRSADEFVPWLSKSRGQPGWQAKLCALASAEYVFGAVYLESSQFMWIVESAIHQVLRGSGYKCNPGTTNPGF